MKKTLLRTLLLLFLIANAGFGFAQTPGITSGAVYSIKSKALNKLLNVSNSSMDNNGNVNCWIDTKSDAQRWIVTNVSDSTYTLTNVGSGKFLHTVTNPFNSSNVDQYTNSNTVKWIIAEAGDGSYYLKTTTTTKFYLNLVAGTVDGLNVNVYQSTGTNSQKWIFQLEAEKEAAPSAAIADQIFAAWKTKYSISTINGFWGTAEMMEIVDDAYEVTGDTKYKSMFSTMYSYFLNNNGSDWMGNEYNDDIAWISIACVRASMLFNNKAYLAKAKDQFDKMYARANTTLYGGGLIWKQGTLTKNSCINGPAMVACCYLAQATGDMTYYDKAIYLYTWSKKYLFNAGTGKLNDAYDGTVHDWSSTYNQGTYLGAAVMLYNYTKDVAYLNDAVKIASYTKNVMYSGKTMNNEDGNDLEGFKGIFMRYARRFTVDCNKTDLVSWLQLNAKVAYNNRNSANIIQTLWGTRTPEITTAKAFGASTAVSLLMNCPRSTTLTKNAFETLEAENFDYLKGINTEVCPEGTRNLTFITTDLFTAYYNIDFGTNGATSAQFRLSSLSDGGTIEIHLGSTTGTLIGTATVTNTGDWNTYTTVTCPITLTKGLQNIYLVFKGSGLICKLNNFKFNEDLVAIDEVRSEKLGITVYPNPVTTEVNVASEYKNIQSITIGDLNGRILYQTIEKDTDAKTIDVSKLASGMYFLTVKTDKNEKIVKKFIK